MEQENKVPIRWVPKHEADLWEQMKEHSLKVFWKPISKEEYETKEHVSGHLMWLENKTDRSEYEEALYKKLKEEQDGKS